MLPCTDQGSNDSQEGSLKGLSNLTLIAALPTMQVLGVAEPTFFGCNQESSVVMSRLQIRFALGSVFLRSPPSLGCAEDNNSPVATEPAPTTTTIAATTTTVPPTTTVELSPEFVVLIGDYSWGRSEGVANLQEVLGIRADGEYGPKTREAHQEALAYLGVENYDFPLAPWETPTTTAAPRSVAQNYLRPSISLECPDDVEDFGEHSWWRMYFGF